LSQKSNMRILVTGSNGFIGKNLVARLNELQVYSIDFFCRENSPENLPKLIDCADFIVHLAGENRTTDTTSFKTINTDLTKLISDAIRLSSRHIPIIFTSSIQAKFDNPYGISKLNAELVLKKLANETGNPIYIFRLPGVFGKWSKPNYNSVVATFCHNIANDLPIQLTNSAQELSLVYIDDVVSKFIQLIENPKITGDFENQSLNFITPKFEPQYKITLEELALIIKSFQNSRNNLIMEDVGSDLMRALYSTYVSYIPPEKFAYKVPCYTDSRGDFIEVLKTKKNGQFSFFSANPGVTRGGHYHHSKTEKFLVIGGTACFKFRNILTDASYEIIIESNKHTIVDTIPGWAHDITNIGDDMLIVMLWANEIFDRDNPDTFSYKV
jgi:UDP-2-acetamido-2,6-beta-L-arabino-hexul-4-ose reductase